MATTQVFNMTKAPRESLADVIVMLNPYDTWFYTNSGDSVADQPTHQWTTDALASPGANAAVEGADVTPAAEGDLTRLQNSCQIIQKSLSVSKTLEASKNVGTKSQAARLLQKRLVELKNDAEYAFLINSAEVTGASGTARQLKGVAGFITTNTASASATGLDLTATLFNNTLQLVWAQMGGTSFDVVCGGYQKRIISGFTGNTRNIQAEAKKQVNVINIYESDFGQCNIHLSTIMHASAAASVYIFGSFAEYWKKAWLRKPDTYDLAVTGSTAAKKALECEVTLECRNEKTGGWIKQNKSS